MRERFRNRLGRIVRALLRGFAAAAACAIAVVAFAAQPIDTIVVRLRDNSASAGGAALAAADRNALLASLGSTFSLVGHTREGGYMLRLATPLALDAARAAVNRARLLPQVLHAKFADPEPAPPDPAFARAALAQQPPVERVIVKYRDAALVAGAKRNDPLPTANLSQLAALAGQPIALQRAMSGGAYVVRLFQALPAEQAASLASYLATDAAIDYAVPDLRKQPLRVPNDPLFASQWHYMSPPGEMGGANLPPAWDLTTGATSIVVAVLDTGSLAAHPDLTGRYVGGYDFIANTQIANDGDGRDSNAADPGDWITSAENAAGFFAGCGVHNSSFHGAHVAGTIGAATDNATGVAGINWVSKILPVRVLGKCGGYTSDVVDAIRWAAGLAVPGVPVNPNPARVLNMSFGGYACDSNGANCACDAPEQSAIDDAIAAGAVPVVAAGNSNRPAVESAPGNCNGVVTVAATGRLGQRASYSNYGPLIEISAPGGADGASVLSTANSGATSPNPAGYTYGNKAGTSMATPHVAGIASLMLSVNPSLTPSQVTSKLSTSARAFPVGTGNDCTTALCGAGIVDAAAAVLASGGSAQPAATTTVLSSSANPATEGNAVTFTATVAGINPTGSVGFVDSGATLASCGNVALTGSGNARTAACIANGLVVGVHSITANYSGDTANSSSSSPPLSQVITPVATSCAAEIVIDNLAPGAAGSAGSGEVSFTGNWAQSGASGWYGDNGSLYSFDDINVADLYTWRTPVLNQSCTYEVYVWWTMHPNRSTSVPITVSGQTSAASTRTFNEQLNGSQWVLHGTYDFAAGARATVQVSNANGQAAADAVRFVLAGAAPDTTPPANATGVSVTDAATGGRLNLAWVNPTADFAGVLILRRAGAAVSEAPATGQSYSAGQALGASTVVYAGAASSYADLNLSNGTTYHYKLFAYDAARNYASGVTGSATPTAPATSCAAEIVIDNLAPGAAGSAGSGEVSFTGNWAQSGASGWYGDNGSLYSFDDINVADLYTWRTPVLNQSCTYEVYVWWTMHPNRSTSVPITVSGQTSAASTRTFNEQLNGSQWVLHGTYAFAAGARATVQVSNANGQAAADAVRFVLAGAAPDTTPPANATGVSVTDAATGGRLNLAWVNPTADFAGVLILRRAGAAVSEAPATGQSYSAGQALGASTVVYAGAASSYADLNLSNGTTYHYKLFAYDAARNYASGVTGSATPTAPATSCAAEIVIDNLAPGAAGSAGSGEVSFTGNWAQSGASGWYGDNGSLYSFDDINVADLYTWRTPVLNQSCTYEVYVWWTMHPNRSTSVPITVSGQTSAASTRTFNEQLNGSQWVLHGTYAFAAGARATVQVSNANGQAAADAVRFVLAGAAPDTTPPANATGVSVTDAATGGRLNLAWVNPTADFAGVLILRRAGAAVSEAPATGQSYSAGQALGASTVVYAGAASSYADLNLSNGTTYHYKLFAYDAARNYASGVTGSATPTAPATSCAAEIVIDNLAPGAAGSAGSGEVSFTGNWAQSEASGWFSGNGSLYSADDVNVADTYTWRTPVLNQSCTYEVYVWWTMHPNRSTSVPITVSGQTSAASTRTFNEQLNGSQWVLHGTYAFAAGARATVQVSNANGQAAADAVRFVLAGAAPTATK